MSPAPRVAAGAAPRIAVVDYGMGNRRSVEKALERVGARALVTADHDELRGADGLAVPGVGAFPRAMRNLADSGLDDLLRERHERGVAILGICLGMQLLFERSTELGGADGLGLLPGEVRQLDAGARKLPHIGWNEVRFTRRDALAEGIGAGDPPAGAFYHVHGFAAHPAEARDVLGFAEYGERFATAVGRGTLFGVQFHPEKSSSDGLRLLANFAALCARVAA